MRKLILYFLIFTLSSHTAYSQIGGKSIYGFLALANHAHTNALGGAYNALQTNQLALLERNPAAVSDTAFKSVNINYMRYFAQTNSGSVYFKPSQKGNWIYGLQYFGYGKMIKTNQIGQIEGNFRAGEYAFSATYTYPLKPQIQLAATILPVFSFLESYNSIGLASRFGILYTSKDQNKALGLSIINLGTQITTYNGTYEPLQPDIILNFNIKLAHAPFMFTVMMHQLNKWDLGFKLPSQQQIDFLGQATQTQENTFMNVADEIFRHTVLAVEFSPAKSFYATLSYNHQRRQEMQLIDKTGFTGMSWGFGLMLTRFQIHFSRATLLVGQQNTQISFQLHLAK